MQCTAHSWVSYFVLMGGYADVFVTECQTLHCGCLYIKYHHHVSEWPAVIPAPVNNSVTIAIGSALSEGPSKKRWGVGQCWEHFRG